MPRCKVKDCRAKLPKDAPPWQEVCSVACSLEWLEVKKAKARALQAKRSKKERYEKVRNFRMQERPHQIRLTQQKFNAMIRSLDKDRGCISCDKGPDWPGQWHAGHFLTTASMPALRFDARNCHKQCSVCNNHFSGRIGSYTMGLEWRYPGIVDWLRSAHAPAKWTCEELAAMRKVFVAETKRLEAGLGASREWRKL